MCMGGLSKAPLLIERAVKPTPENPIKAVSLDICAIGTQVVENVARYKAEYKLQGDTAYVNYTLCGSITKG